MNDLLGDSIQLAKVGAGVNQFNSGDVEVGVSSAPDSSTDMGMSKFFEEAALKKGTMGWKRVVATFGKEILLENGEVDRARLGNIIFGDPAKRKSLNSALSLSITLGIFWNLLKYWIVGTKVVILDVPLLFETKFRKITKPIIVVWVDAVTQLERLMKRDKISKEQALNKINSQLSLDWKHDQADFVIDNSGTLEATKVQVHEVWTHITTPLTWKELLFSRSVVVAVIAVAVLFWIFKS